MAEFTKSGKEEQKKCNFDLEADYKETTILSPCTCEEMLLLLYKCEAYGVE